MRFVLILTIGNCLPETSPFFVCPNGIENGMEKKINWQKNTVTNVLP